MLLFQKQRWLWKSYVIPKLPNEIRGMAIGADTGQKEDGGTARVLFSSIGRFLGQGKVADERGGLFPGTYTGYIR